MKKLTCQECHKVLSRGNCVRKPMNILIHGGSCGGIVKEELVLDMCSAYRRRKNHGKS